MKRLSIYIFSSKAIWEYFIFPRIEFVVRFSTLHISPSIGRISIQVCTTRSRSLFNSNGWLWSTQNTWVVNFNRWVCLTQITWSSTLIDEFVQLKSHEFEHITTSFNMISIIMGLYQIPRIIWIILKSKSSNKVVFS
jgi:hypothetical protein